MAEHTAHTAEVDGIASDKATVGCVPDGVLVYLVANSSENAEAVTWWTWEQAHELQQQLRRAIRQAQSNELAHAGSRVPSHEPWPTQITWLDDEAM